MDINCTQVKVKTHISDSAIDDETLNSEQEQSDLVSKASPEGYDVNAIRKDIDNIKKKMESLTNKMSDLSKGNNDNLTHNMNKVLNREYLKKRP